MAQLTLSYYVVFGDGDASDDVEFTTEISDEEAVAFKEAVEQGIDMTSYPPLAKACERIQDEADQYGRADFEDNKWWDDDDEDEGFSDGWYTGVRWPDDLSACTE